MATLIKRGKTHHAHYWIGGKAHRETLKTTELHIAKEKARHLESALARRQVAFRALTGRDAATRSYDP